MRVYILLGITIIGLLVLGGYFISLYGQARYDAGVSDTRAEQSDKQIEEVKENNKKLRRIRNDKLTEEDTSNELLELGIMRRPSER